MPEKSGVFLARLAPPGRRRVREGILMRIRREYASKCPPGRGRPGGASLAKNTRCYTLRQVHIVRQSGACSTCICTLHRLTERESSWWERTLP